MENLLASWKAGIGAILYSTLVGSVGIGARLLVEEDLEDDLLVLLLLRLVCEDVETLEEVLTAEFVEDFVEDFAEVAELVFLLVDDSMVEDFAVMLVDEALIEDFEEDFADVLVLNFLLVEETLVEDFEDDLAANWAEILEATLAETLADTFAEILAATWAETLEDTLEETLEEILVETALPQTVFWLTTAADTVEPVARARRRVGPMIYILIVLSQIRVEWTGRRRLQAYGPYLLCYIVLTKTPELNSVVNDTPSHLYRQRSALMRVDSWKLQVNQHHRSARHVKKTSLR
jgi:hypothetical protein